MTSSYIHPRRRFLYSPDTPAFKRPSIPFNVSTALNPSLKKSATFHSPSSPQSNEDDPILNIPFLPRRSPTCHTDLEDLIAAGDNNRIKHLIGAVDRSLSGLQSFTTDSQETFAAEEYPVPRFLVDGDHQMGEKDNGKTDLQASMDVDSSPRKHHASDSGIGSSVSSMVGDGPDVKQAPATKMINNTNISNAVTKTAGRLQSGINGVMTTSLAGTGAFSSAHHALSEYACRKIHKHIILPIVREEKLKAFHPLVKGIPLRVAKKEITCLRDLEKVLLWLAPTRSVSKTAFLFFCETTIQCLHTTVSHINDNDQRRPTDRGYSNGYFLDLVEQVRQYATMLSRHREMASTVGSAGPSTDEKITLVGGLSRTGRPAELIRTRGGKSISLRTGEELSPESYHQGVKRSMSEECDEDTLRSMARRKKSAGPLVRESPKCAECDKVFKRPCDLTKHEKTHSRPWKCDEAGCKYHEYGWPTEKERDRHMNDKHSAAPSMFKCHYHPCPYESKRESNCKQHMEKAHGWLYVRSKHSGKGPKDPRLSQSPPTPQLSTPGSPIFTVTTPETHERPASFRPLGGYERRGSLTGPAIADVGDLCRDVDIAAFQETFGPVHPNFAWNDDASGLGSESLPEHTSQPVSWDSSVLDAPGMTEEESLFGSDFNWAGNVDLTSMNAQLFTPAASVNDNMSGALSPSNSLSVASPHQSIAQVPTLSPGGHGEAMLYTPYSMGNDMHQDEGFSEFTDDMRKKPTQDFSLFSEPADFTAGATAINDSMFQDLQSLASVSTYMPQHLAWK